MRICAVIPAAGRGSRLGIDRPKLLAPVAGCDTVWTILSSRLIGLVDHIHVVLSPSGAEAFRHVKPDVSNGPGVSYSIQPQPIGMGDAVFRGYPVWSQAEILVVIWGDQIHVSRETVEQGLSAHDASPRQIVIPLVSLPKPYVEYRFDAAGRLTAVLQAREEDLCLAGGLSDVGTFILSTDGLMSEWSEFALKEDLGKQTGEISFLPFLVFLAQKGWDVKRSGVPDALEARGINTREDLAFFRNVYGPRACTTTRS